MGMITKLVYFLAFFGYAAILFASTDWNEYDKIWERKNPVARQEVLKRGLLHYKKGVSYLDENRLKDARVEFSDALKVLPGFADAHSALSGIYAKLGENKKAQKEKELYEKFKNELSPSDEYAYLSKNIERLKKSYKPGSETAGIAAFLLGVMLFSVFILFAYLLNLPFYVKMKIIGFYRKLFKDRNSEMENKIIIGRFPGDDEG